MATNTISAPANTPAPSSSTNAILARPPRTGAAIGIYLLLGLGAVAMLLPFFWMLSTSLKQPSEVFTFPPQWLPKTLQFKNYSDAWTALPFNLFYRNSLIVAITGTFFDALTSSLAAFAFSRLRFPGRDKIFLLYLAALMIPQQVTLIPSFIIIRYLGLYNTYGALILPGIFSAFSMFLLRQFYRSIPSELDEAARMDGASSLRIWLQLVLPLGAPALSAVVIFSFLGKWNAFLWPLMVTRTMDMRTLPVGLSMFQGQYNTQWHLLMAGAILTLAPALIVYIIGQKWIVQAVNLSGGGAK